MAEEQKIKNNRKVNVKLLIGIGAAVVLLILLAVIVVPKTGKAQKVQEQLNLGAKYLSELNYEQAIIAYTAAIEIDPKRVDVYLGLADVYAAMGDFDKAEEILGIAQENVTDRDDLEKIKKKQEEIVGIRKKNDEKNVTPTPEPTVAPSPMSTPTLEPTATPSPMSTPTLEPTATPSPTSTPTPEPTATPVPTSTPTPQGQAQDLPSVTPAKPEPTATPIPTSTPTPEPTATPIPTNTPTPMPTSTPTPRPTNTPIPTSIVFPSIVPVPTSVPVAFNLPNEDSEGIFYVSVNADYSAIEISIFSESDTFDASVSYYVAYLSDEDMETIIGNTGASMYAMDAFNKNSTVSYLAEKAGNYAIHISNAVKYNAHYYSGTNVHELNFSYRVVKPDVNEPNNEIYQATQIVAGKCQFFTLIGEKDNDWFVIDIPENISKIELTIDSENGRFDSYLGYTICRYDETTEETKVIYSIWGSYASGARKNTIRKQQEITEPGLYYINVSNAALRNSIYYHGDNKNMLYILVNFLE